MSDESESTLSPADRLLFRSTVGPTRRLAAHARAWVCAKPKPKPRRLPWHEEPATRSPDDETAAAPGAVLSFLRPGCSPRLLQQLKKGRYRVQDELDLHHMSMALAKACIEQFLAEALAEELHCVRIIHGKGLRSQNGNAVLKGLTNQLLRRHQAVLAFASTQAAQGGSGAVVVWLARRR